MPLKIYNTLTRREEIFSPIEAGHIKIYACGPTVYDLSHIGHARVYVVLDTIVRFLRQNFNVTYVRNYTDIDDKIIKRAIDTKQSCNVVSESNITAFKEDMQSLHVLPADIEPKVTDHIAEVIAMITTLLERNVAYLAGGDVYFAVESFATYGKLGHRSLEDMEAGIRVEVAQHKRHPMDFVLWKAAKPNEPAWDSPWGAGRPGWHIECSAMSKRYLGDTLDIHAGGRDLIFPHHENEIAQSESANQTTFTNVWIHHGLLNIDNQKMSKSLGNFFTIRDILKKYDAQTLRFYLLSTQYRSPMHFSDAQLKDAQQRVKYMYQTMLRLEKHVDISGPYAEDMVANIVNRFDASMQADFNTPQAIGDLSECFKTVNHLLDHPQNVEQDKLKLCAMYKGLHEVGHVLGLFLEPSQIVLKRITMQQVGQHGLDVAQIENLIQQRTAARSAKDFGRADALRAELLQQGVIIQDIPGSTTWDIVTL